MKCVGSVYWAAGEGRGEWGAGGRSAHAGVMKNVMGTTRCFPSQPPRGRPGCEGK